ncbi:DUF6882 domain-containing protein [Paraburkholderia megapolitana]|uniref:Uncharacterized protein n=1 Tax=Paraburkholderia megapolitana TaxID=420953 RepID=A0A1I3KYJ8_9BURK|nr:DUF6882 domain-containing protein [Paraburkholderia megapolitana]QDQ80500.1 hypothetical protein FNZ07_04595 [Paraburkholderia megapolitana]SFI77592.1 hypothetical protein SAMN05192543_104175 [Paraburkholderia megapolitana]
MANFLKKLFGGNDKGAGGDGGDRNGDGPTLAEPDLTIARANNEMQMRTQTAINMWGLDTAAWNADLDAGTITFTNDEKGLVVTAPVQVVGTYNTEDGTWLWGWDHPSVSEPLGEHARRVRDFGERYGLNALTTRKIEASKADAWGFTALACHLGGGQGGYSGPDGPALVFMTYGAVTISKKG